MANREQKSHEYAVYPARGGWCCECEQLGVSVWHPDQATACRVAAKRVRDLEGN